MSSLGTSSPVSASTFRYLMRWPVFRLSWLNEIFSLSEVAGYSATGHVTRESLRKPFQLARGAITQTSFGPGLDSGRFNWSGSDTPTVPPSIHRFALRQAKPRSADSRRMKREHWACPLQPTPQRPPLTALRPLPRGLRRGRSGSRQGADRGERLRRGAGRGASPFSFCRLFARPFRGLARPQGLVRLRWPRSPISRPALRGRR